MKRHCYIEIAVDNSCFYFNHNIRKATLFIEDLDEDVPEKYIFFGEKGTIHLELNNNETPLYSESNCSLQTWKPK